jgi:hypothetical protein
MQKYEKHPCSREKGKNCSWKDGFHRYRACREAMLGKTLSGRMFFIFPELRKEMHALGKMFLIFPGAVFS